MPRFFPLLIVLGLCLTVACTRVADLSPEGPAQVVVNCVLSVDETQTLSLSLTDIATDAEKVAMENADIQLTDITTGANVGRFIRDGEIWRLLYSAVPEHSYRLSIRISEREEILASTTMPPECSITYFKLEPGVEHYDYETDLHGEHGARYYINSLPEGPVWVMGMNYNPETGQHDVAELIAISFTVGADPFNVTSSIFYSNDYFAEELRHYSWISCVRLYRYVDGKPFYPKMIRIRPLKEVGIRSAPDALNCFSVAGTFEGDYFFKGEPSETQGYVRFVSVSEEYDRFLKEALTIKKQQESLVDFSSLFSRENPYTNIVNGVGVFGARTEQKLPWTNKVKWDTDWW